MSRIPKNWGVVAVLAAILGGGFLYHQRSGSNNGTDAPMAAAVEPKQILLVPPQTKDAGPQAPAVAKSIAAPPDWKSNKFFSKYNNARDLRQFAELARRDPQSGGFYYATLALQECQRLRGPIMSPQFDKVRTELQSPQAKNAEARLAAFRWSDDRCQNFTDSELSSAEFNVMVKSREAAMDPVRAVRIKKLDPTASDFQQQREQLLGELLSFRDPVLLTHISSVAWSRGPEARGVFVDGVENAGLDTDSLLLAWRLMTCRVAGTCAEVNSEMQFICVMQGYCASNEEAGIRLQAGKKYDRISTVADRLIQIVDEKNVRALMPPS